MASSLTLINHALVLLGEQPITATDQLCKPARTANALYDIVRDSELAGHPWHFAKKRQQLAPVCLPDIQDRQSRYVLPGDWLRSLGVYCADGKEEREVSYEGPYIIVASSMVLELLYICRVEDTNCYPALFKEALAIRLAATMAENLAGSVPGKAENLWRQYDATLRKAKQANALAAVPSVMATSNWIHSRS
jgi:hypothetical protein